MTLRRYDPLGLAHNQANGQNRCDGLYIVSIRINYYFTVMMEPQIPGYRVQQNSLRFYNILSLPSNVLATIIRFLSPPFAMLFRRMFQKWHRIDHLETSIRFSVLALSATSQSHPRLAHYQQRLAVSLRDRYRKLGKIWDLRCAILLQKSALTNVLAGDPDLSWHQQNLVVSYHALCSRFGKLEDMNTTLELQHRIYSTLRDDDPTRSWWMRNIATTYQGLHIYTGDMDNLESGIYWANMSLDNTPDGDEDLPERQLVLAALLMDRSKTSNNISDMDRAIELDCAALEATPKGTIEHALCAMSLVSSYGIRYGQFKTPGDLESALRLSEQTINDMPQDTNYYPQFSHAASEQYLHKHRKDNDTADLHKALRHSKNAVAATPSGRPSSGVYKGHLSVIYLDYYHRFGSMSDLELAIDINISALALLPEGHVRMPFQQLHMSLLYYSQCLRHRDAQVLERALHWGGLARQGTSKKDSLYLHCLHNLGLLYHLKFQISQDVKDLDNAVDMMREAIDATPPNGPDLPVRYSTMANLYASRYQFLGGRETRDESLKWMRAAVDAAERLGDPELPARQNALAVQLFNNYIRLREEQDLESALQLSLSATAETPDDSAVGASRFSTLAGIYAEKYALEHREDLRDLTLKTFRHASGFTGSNPDSQWQLARKWVMFADSVPSPEALDAYAFAFNIIPTLLWLGSNITTRHEALVKYDISGMASNAVVSCIENENYGLAVEFLEQNLSITFNQLLDLQTDLSLLSENHSDLAQGLGSISAELRQLAIATGDPNEVGDKTSSITSDKTRKLALERDTLLQQIRDLPGFEHFLLPIPFSKLRQAAIHGPIVMISCTSHRCDALILTNTDAPVLHLRLFRVNTKILHVQRQRLKKALESLGIHARDLRDGDRAGRIAQRQRAPEGTMLDEVLEWLWTFVVSPIYGLLKNVRGSF